MNGEYPEDISCIVNAGINNKGAIYISNLEAAQNIDTLKKYGIGAVLTAADGVMLCHPRQIVKFYKQITALDHQSFDLSVYFEDAIKFIEEARRATNVLVHCVAGISRSVTLVLAYLIKNYRISLSEALTLVRSRRKIISPNQGFLKQLTNFQQIIHGPHSQRCHSEVHSRKFYSQKSAQLHNNSKRPQSLVKNNRILIDTKMIDRKIWEIKNKYVSESLVQKLSGQLPRPLGVVNRKLEYDYYPIKMTERIALRKGMMRF